MARWRRAAVRGIFSSASGERNSRRQFSQSVPVRFLAYDLLEEKHDDLRALPMRERRARLEALLQWRRIRDWRCRHSSTRRRGRSLRLCAPNPARAASKG